VVQAIMARVFLSHSSKDEVFVRELHRRLRRDGLTCFFDEESIEWGENFVVSLERGIDECEFFVAVLSPEFVQSKWVELERTSAMTDDPAGLERKMRPLLLRPCEVPRFLKPIQLIDVSSAALFEENYPRICGGLGGTVRPDPEAPTDRGALPPVTPLPPLYRMPYRSLGDKFVGRVEPLWRVLASAEVSCAPGHPSIVARQSNLALVLQDLGELEEARDLLRQALASAEATYAPGNPSTATRQSNLATVLKDLGELEEARDLLRKALASVEAKYAPGHPSIARNQSNLAMVLSNLGELEEARDLLKKAYATALSLLGSNHPMTRKFRGNLEGLEGSGD
jgi:plasmid stability protein